MSGGSGYNFRRKRSKGKTNRKQKYRLLLKRLGLNEHHRKPRSRNGGRGHSDLNIVKVGIQIHRCFHTLFDVEPPEGVITRVNEEFVQEPDYLVLVPTKFFPAFHRYFTNQQVLEWKGMAGYGLTWGHLFLYGTPEDLLGNFRAGRYDFAKPDPAVDVTNRWQYLFRTLSLPVIAHELTRYWLPLDSVVIAIPKEHREEVSSFLSNLSDKKKRR